MPGPPTTWPGSSAFPPTTLRSSGIRSACATGTAARAPADPSSPPSEHSCGRILDDLDQRSHPGAGASLGGVTERPVVERRPGDVQVGPVDAVRHELLEEDAGRQRAAPA